MFYLSLLINQKKIINYTDFINYQSKKNNKDFKFSKNGVLAITLNLELEKLLGAEGAIKVGVATKETLSGGPPSADITYLLPEAESAVCFALPLNRDLIRAFLGKKLPNGRADHEKDNIETNIKAYKIAKKVANYLESKGYKAIPVVPNNKYRHDLPGWQIRMPPELSLRYIAVRSGVASFGWSGNVGIKGFGTAIILGCLITAAKITPTEPLPPKENFCTKCKLCVKVCGMRMFDEKEEASVTLGEISFNYSKRIDLRRCHIVCGGFSGLDKSGKWSTWSPGRYDYPEDAQELGRLYPIAMYNALNRPAFKDSTGYAATQIGETVRLTCGNCQLICWGDPKETAENYRILTKSGCVIQKENGNIVVLPPDEAEKAFEAMDPAHKKLYYKDYKHAKKEKESKEKAKSSPIKEES